MAPAQTCGVDCIAARRNLSFAIELPMPVCYILGLLLFIWWCITIKLGSDHGVPRDVRRPELTRWIRPYLTSRPRWIFANFLYLVILLLQVIEAGVVAGTEFDMLWAAWTQWPIGGPVMHILYITSIFGFLCFVAFTVAFMGFVIMCQVSCLLELRCYEPGVLSEVWKEEK